MRHKRKWDIITSEDLENAKPEIKEGDFVVVNTG
jgi:kynurenine formamidase